jgi:hypothetical protein
MLSKPKLSKAELFRSHLEQIIDMSHSMVSLSRQINWNAFSDRFGSLYHDRKGRPGLPIRWHKRIGVEGVEFLLQETINSAQRSCTGG